MDLFLESALCANNLARFSSTSTQGCKSAAVALGGVSDYSLWESLESKLILNGSYGK